MAQFIDVIAEMIARDGIDYGDGRRNDKTRCVTNRRRRPGGRLHNFFAKAHSQLGQGLAAIDAAADEFDDLWIFGESSMVQLVLRVERGQIDNIDLVAGEFALIRLDDSD